jgi:hypothetical protein
MQVKQGDTESLEAFLTRIEEALNAFAVHDPASASMKCQEQILYTACNQHTREALEVRCLFGARATKLSDHGERFDLLMSCLHKLRLDERPPRVASMQQNTGSTMPKSMQWCRRCKLHCPDGFWTCACRQSASVPIGRSGTNAISEDTVDKSEDEQADHTE